MKNNNGLSLLELLLALSILTVIVFLGSSIHLTGWNMFRDSRYLAQAQRNASVPLAHIEKHVRTASILASPSEDTLDFNILSMNDPIPSQYQFSAGTILYDEDTDDLIDPITIGKNINTCTFTLVEDSDSNATSVRIAITAYDNRNSAEESRSYNLQSIVQPRGASIPSPD